MAAQQMFSCDKFRGQTNKELCSGWLKLWSTAFCPLQGFSALFVHNHFLSGFKTFTCKPILILEPFFCSNWGPHVVVDFFKILICSNLFIYTLDHDYIDPKAILPECTSVTFLINLIFHFSISHPINPLQLPSTFWQSASNWL